MKGIQSVNCGVVSDYYRCPEEFGEIEVSHAPADQTPGFFHFQSDVVCHGRCSAGYVAPHVNGNMFDAWHGVRTKRSVAILPFDPGEVVQNLRHERYVSALSPNGIRFAVLRVCRDIYYRCRAVIPTGVRAYLKQIHLRVRGVAPFPRWPVDTTVDLLLEHLVEVLLNTQRITEIPFIWFWPSGYDSCAIMTHDTEAHAGYEFIGGVMDMDDTAGIKASFQIIPERRYAVNNRQLRAIRARGFELNVHDLNHDGRLFDDRCEFLKRARQINKYGQEYGSAGYRSAVMQRNLEWYGALNFEYDMSVPNVASLDPQRGGCCTVMPYFVGNILELPLTTLQDYFLFYILKQRSIELWKQQIEIIRRRHGLISFLVHPDYVIPQRNRATFQLLLEHLAGLRASGQVWFALPRDVNWWWRERSKMRLARCGTGWKIEGEGSERARIAYAYLKDGKIAYRISRSHSASNSAEEDTRVKSGTTS
jgi:hypothetical protein